MLAFVVALFLAVLVAAVVLADEARTGRLVGKTARRTRGRAAVFFAATVAGGAMLAALPRSEWLFALALLPITAVCLLRFSMLAREWWGGWRLAVFTLLLVGLGIAACLPFLPVPLSRRVLLERLGPGRPSGFPDTIAPDAGHPLVRV